jgi:hypothetical protein
MPSEVIETVREPPPDKQRGGVNKQATGNLREGRKMAGGSRMNRPCCVCGGFGWTGGEPYG